MIISSLCEYYRQLAQNGKVLPEGYSKIQPKYLVLLSEEGKICDIVFLGEEIQNGKKTVYRFKEVIMPLRSEKPAIEANIVEHRPLYLFGLTYEKSTGEFVQTEKSIKSNKAFKEKTIGFFEGINSPLAKAFYLFATNWDPSQELQNENLRKIAKDYDMSNYVFCLQGNINAQLQDDDEVKRSWNKYYLSMQSDSQSFYAQCPIYGEELPVALLHNVIKKIKGGQSSGCKMVCVNNPSEESYGKKQAYNSSVSEKAMKEYTEAFNYLLANSENVQSIDEMTVIHFALNSKSEEEVRFVNRFAFFNFAKKDDVEEVNEGLANSLKKIANGEKPDFENYEKLDDNVKYCIFGLVPNASRISVKFYYQNTFGELKKNILKYHQDFAVEDGLTAPPIRKLKEELISPKAKDVLLPPEIGECLISCMLEGTPFPDKLLQVILRRIKTDSDEEKKHYIKMNNIRIGLLKACLTRKYKEDISMSLDVNNTNAAYLCGRLFAVLEKIQQDSADGQLNRTIKDSFFASAMTNPSVTFARLMKLSKNHLAKLEQGNQVYYNRLEGEIMDSLTEFPKTLSLQEQGHFVLGYYQQNKKLYTKKSENSEEN